MLPTLHPGDFAESPLRLLSAPVVSPQPSVNVSVPLQDLLRAGDDKSAMNFTVMGVNGLPEE